MMENFADPYLLFLGAVILGGVLEPNTTWKVIGEGRDESKANPDPSAPV
jgi:hypothetical protein